MAKRIVLADPRGFCAGVDRAILTVQTILKAASARVDGLPPVYVRRQIVHNRHVVEDLAAQGAVFVQELAEIPDEAAAAGIPIVFSAHGVSPQVKAEAARRGMHVVDATCPLVSKVHREVLRFVREGYEIIYIGHRGHDEAVGVVGEDPVHVHLIEHEADVDSLDFRPEQKLVLLTQTTLSIDETAGTIAALKCRFPWMKEPPSSDICYATSNRQAAVKLVAEQSDSVVIVGSANSSNSVRLMEVAQEALEERGRAHRVDDANELAYSKPYVRVFNANDGAATVLGIAAGEYSTLAVDGKVTLTGMRRRDCPPPVRPWAPSRLPTAAGALLRHRETSGPSGGESAE